MDQEPSTPDLECRNLTKAFADFTAVRDVSFSVPPGSFFSILGPSGCGKTTLLRMVAGFIEPTSGDILIKGRSMLDVAPNRRPVNMVFQHLALFPMMNVFENIAFGLKRRGVAADEVKNRVMAVLERVGLPHLAERKTDQLSGGQKQRIAIARCMVLEPDVLLLDEPLGALDLKLREHMKVELKKLQTEFNTTFVYITHDQSEALVMSDQVAVMNKGVFEQVGAARDLYYEPKSAFVAGFVGDANRWNGSVESIDGDGVRVRTADGGSIIAQAGGPPVSAGDHVAVFVRPEAVRLARTAAAVADLENHIAVSVESVLFNGANSRVLVRTPGDNRELDVAVPQTGEFRDLKSGDAIHVGWNHDQARCFVTEAE